MNVKLLNSEEALQTGAELWILPQLGHSEWTKQLDWPLNMQITRAAHHQAPEMSMELKQILAENRYQFQIKTPTDPLMISTNGLLPTRIVAIVGADKWENWLRVGLDMWKNLKQPAVRIFLPAGVAWQSVKNNWPEWADLETVQVVESHG